jgi:chemotaxis protein methyltransferase CheR
VIDNQPTLHVTEDVPRLSDHDYVRFSELLLQRCGLHFSEKRRIELEIGIRHAFAASTCSSLDEYFRSLSQDGGLVQGDQLINAVTVSETHFFRDAAQFDALYHHILPEIIQRRRSVRTLRIWSAGCASGEEPYSIAMLLRELLPDAQEWAITILGTDINTQALARARRGSYSDWAFREARAKEWRPRYFKAQGNRYELSPEVRRMVTFEQLNLAEACYPSYETNTMFMDLVLCRNVTIYFGEQVICQVVDRFYDTLVDGGWLVVGHCEPSLMTYRRFQARNFPNTVAYQRTGQPTILPTDWDVLAACHEDGNSCRTLPAEPVLVSATEESPVPDDAPGVTPQPHQDPFQRAQELLEYGHAEQARDTLLELVASGTCHAPTYALLGRACANLGDWPKAEHWCQEALVCDRLLLPAYYTLALVLQHQDRLDAAVAAMKKVVYIDQDHVLGHFGLAGLSHTLGRQQQAFKSLDNACRLLRAFDDDEIIPESGGITAGRLREATIRLQQQWTRQGAN